ncbi:MAG: universal stress protein [Halobacteriales archaeon]
MYDTVLFPTDGERSSEEAAADAVELASLHDATLHVLHVVDEATVEVLAEAGDMSRDEVQGSLEDEGNTAVEAVADEARDAGVDAESEVAHGKPDDVIVERADELDADVIVMGTEEQPSEYRDLLGSVTESVLRKTMARVLVVKTEAEIDG